MVGYAADMLNTWISKSSDIELTHAYYDCKMSEDLVVKLNGHTRRIFRSRKDSD